MNIVALGLDAGSTTAKIVGVDTSGNLVWHHLEPTEPLMEEQATRLVRRGRDAAGAPVPVVATGYGRKLVREADRAVTEITCHATGVYRALGHGGTLVDIGGQDSKVIVVDPAGTVANFGMNDRCAAGTGRFLEVAAARLGLDLDQFSSTALAGTEEAAISSTCTVFAESELISTLARGVPLAQVARGLFRSLARRVGSLARSVGTKPPMMLSGGVAQSEAMRALLAEELGAEVSVSVHPQLMGAYGAALLALRRRTIAEPPGGVVPSSEPCPSGAPGCARR